jgi:peptidoglycan/LPS O-acetylase OafA/YrhL
LRFVSSGDSTKRSDGFQRAASSGDFGLGAIRFLLAFAVVGAHVGKIPYHVPLSSLLAVEAFYIISGFLIALVWDNKYASRPNGLFLFYTNRAARIYWLYWVVLAISIAVAIGAKLLTRHWVGYFTIPPRGLALYEIFTNLYIFGSA